MTTPLPGGAPADALASSPSEKKAAAKAIEKHIHPDTKTAGDYADEKTNTAVKEFDARDGHGWATSTALRKAHKEWGKQVKSLLHRLGSDHTSLIDTGLMFQRADGGAAGMLRPPSALDDF
ncbi:hypothetical protein [Streptomyces xiaopingdaonensis]|uniref:hypothetical protein n=1 Tax=Streptomyces xiaopingdaonensis TaxID=1565415 RepID=UPI0002DABB7E|nr:hypothetical protein [Streptomyces xiaopingdaonensis]